jgi:tight adherence protein B
MIGVVAAVLAGYGVFLVYTSVVLGWRGLRVGPARSGGTSGAGNAPRMTLRQRLDRAGLYDVAPGELLASMALLALVGGGLSFVLFGSAPPAAVGAGFAATLPVAAFRERRQRRLEAAAESWPRMLEELRLLTGSVGRSIPQALFEVGRRAPEPLRPAFEAAEREWMLTTDFDRTAQLLKQRLADPTADTVCETLVVAHQVGGGGLDHRLAELIEDRILELQGRKDAASKQAGVRFARRFVLVVPLGMALAGLSIGTGRASYETSSGQWAVVAGLLAVVVCWYWSGRLMRVPGEPRVFLDADDADLDRVAAGR